LSSSDGSDAGCWLAPLKDKEHHGGEDKNDSGSNRDGQPVALPGFGGADQFEIRWSAHVRILHPFPKEYAAQLRSDLLNKEILNSADKYDSVTISFRIPHCEWNAVQRRNFYESFAHRLTVNSV
jgi:hypothetical protein